jgi:phospholipid/cholesterol/gamma-HCH transport system substrate-binding protein
VARISNEVKVGLTVIGALLVAFFGFRYMRDVPLLRQSNEIYAKFARVDGINPGSQVLVNGVKVGTVKKINLTASDSVKVTMTLNVGNQIPKGSVALLQPIDMLGSKAIVIKRSDRKEMVTFGGRIDGEYVESMVESLKEEGEKLGRDLSGTVNQFNTLLENVNSIAGKKNREEIEVLLKNLRATSIQLNDIIQEKRSEVDQSITTVNSILGNVDTMTTNSQPKVDKILTQLQTTTKELEGVSAKLNTSTDRLNTILGKLESGEGSLGKLIQDPSLYNNVDSLSYELHKLTKQLNEDPKSYLKHLKLFSIF